MPSRISTLREAAGETQEQLNERLSWPKDVIADYESCKESPTDEDIVALANALGSTVDYLLGMSDAPDELAPVYDVPQGNTLIRVQILHMIADNM